ncbi:hypothetical protein [Sphingobium aromaticiconvertens]|uniref:hypothetical protein n=1 Tax=Sphingobium aromaticiconvertens TaxID=365341 RepID=UPI00301990B7
MSRSKAKTTQEKPTAPRSVDGAGRQVDQWDLPYSGPARVRALEELGKPDPNIEPEAWAPPITDTSLTEQNNG